jgi:hypothetical protein
MNSQAAKMRVEFGQFTEHDLRCPIPLHALGRSFDEVGSLVFSFSLRRRLFFLNAVAESRKRSISLLLRLDASIPSESSFFSHRRGSAFHFPLHEEPFTPLPELFMSLQNSVFLATVLIEFNGHVALGANRREESELHSGEVSQTIPKMMDLCREFATQIAPIALDCEYPLPNGTPEVAFEVFGVGLESGCFEPKPPTEIAVAAAVDATCFLFLTTGMGYSVALSLFSIRSRALTTENFATRPTKLFQPVGVLFSFVEVTSWKRLLASQTYQYFVHCYRSSSATLKACRRRPTPSKSPIAWDEAKGRSICNPVRMPYLTASAFYLGRTFHHEDRLFSASCSSSPCSPEHPRNLFGDCFAAALARHLLCQDPRDRRPRRALSLRGSGLPRLWLPPAWNLTSGWHYDPIVPRKKGAAPDVQSETAQISKACSQREQSNCSNGSHFRKPYRCGLHVAARLIIQETH